MVETSSISSDFDPRKIGVIQDDNSSVDADGGDIVQFVSFKVGDSEYCVDIMAVREIKGWAEVTDLPNTPEFVRGVLNLRGIIVPIFDLRCRFGQGLTECTALHVMIILQVEDRIMGILVDAVSDIITVNTNEILPAPTLDKKSEQKFISGLMTVQERMVALLEIEKLFDLETIVEAAIEE
ncbi:chemotaxis protein CheW [Temperatibacter marinus]|uniref:Chemotaxis protein CheW n=1 Tax=Temperatibacter marinus TaxID=1456591 RepID=A0AA52ECC3_9PROT|nr:chemotaxis protein CheW [Temperatibacter marinus]WND02100.1 chemotaxis protein CheW [Temperatibacter marinus]